MCLHHPSLHTRYHESRELLLLGQAFQPRCLVELGGEGRLLGLHFRERLGGEHDWQHRGVGLIHRDGVHLVVAEQQPQLHLKLLPLHIQQPKPLQSLRPVVARALEFIGCEGEAG